MTTYDGLKALMHLFSHPDNAIGIRDVRADTLRDLEAQGMIAYTGSMWHLTDKGRVFMRAVLALPYPVPVEKIEWKMP